VKGTRRLVLGCATVALALTSMLGGALAAPKPDPAHAGRAVVRLVDFERLLKAKDHLAPTLAGPAPAVRHLVDVRGLLKEPGIAPLGAEAPQTAQSR
jgi:hypothetical protein